MKSTKNRSSKAPLRLILISSAVIVSGCRQQQEVVPPVDLGEEQAEKSEQAKNERPTPPVSHTGYRPVWPIFGTNSGWYSSGSSSRSWSGTTSRFSASPSTSSSHSGTATSHSASPAHTSSPSHSSHSSTSVSRGGFGGHASASS